MNTQPQQLKAASKDYLFLDFDKILERFFWFYISFNFLPVESSDLTFIENNYSGKQTINKTDYGIKHLKLTQINNSNFISLLIKDIILN
jgi:hypothetical protein